ncbi:hypothetical protein [Spirosoma utsteinense]|uniref:DUF481 domain-containing protein n=1 Tax=Spirosoma utsteinense TaxID=2585773 RepID=A0ABR6W7Z5_9BACT|nr:hypothetical protein [Spirosoma utsteinense]MBC3789042.1 hypothetical protein [Spirosoma utsteinense]MBC3792632.1 hypothetical protein [Spirosoma utsteinense]
MNYIYALIISLLPLSAWAQKIPRATNAKIKITEILKDPEAAPPKLFLNCQNVNCFDDYVRTQLSFFDFVRDRQLCDIEILTTQQTTGASGSEYTLTLLGQNRQQGLIDTLRFTTRQTDTDAMIRQRFVQSLRLGLVRFMTRTSFMQQVLVTFPKRKAEPDDKPKRDPWHFWVFILSANASANGESNHKYLSLNEDVKINRVTLASKFNFDAYYNTTRNRYDVNEQTIDVKNIEFGLSALYVRSLSEHWSVGGLYKGYHSIYQNMAFSQSVSPALEYNLFPNSEVTRRQFRWIYQIGLRSLSYIDSTVYNKTAETLPFQQLTGIFAMTEPWGSLNASIAGYQFLHDLSKNRLTFQTTVSWRILEGLMLQLNGEVSLINNQISLAKEIGDPNQFLLGGRQLPTRFNYSSSVGLSFTFGSINNAAVNPRFTNVDF